MKTYLFFFFLLLPAVFISAQESKLTESVKVKSAVLNEDINVAVYLPAGYETSNRNYPVLYLLHGLGDDQTGWVQFGDVQQIADKQINSGEAVPMIIVMPDAKRTFYVNNYDGSYKYEDFFIKELIPYIEKNYRARTDKEFRAVSGLSMGGYGSLLYSMHHPDLFTACYAMSAAVFTDDEIIKMDDDTFNEVFGFSGLFGKNKGKDRICKYYNDNSILYLAANMPDNQKDKVRFYVDCGDDDFLFRGNSALHVMMREKNIPHEYRVKQGGHEWPYWRSALHEALKFVSQSFHR